MAWWRQARFGMFIHWGLYAVPAGTWNGRQIPGIGEWIMNKGRIPVADYSALAARFDPVRFDAQAWADLAREAGMKYIVITAKHHDGFAMFASSADPYNIVDATPFKRDVLAELAAACRKDGIRLGFYYSQAQDWHAPGAAANGGHWDKAQDGDMDAYLRAKAVPQIRELLTRYGEFPSVLWFDTPTGMNRERADLILPLLRLRPGIIVNNRLVRGLGGVYEGDTETPEQRIPPRSYPGRDWETCMTINGTWGYKSYDENWKSDETLLRNLIDIASKGGNYLLNVGPDALGVIPDPEVQRLKAMGRWLAVNGESIYGTGPTPFGAEAGAPDPAKRDSKGKPVWVPSWKWRCTSKPGALYFHLFEWPGGTFTAPAVPGTIVRAYLLADPRKRPLPVTRKGDSVSIGLPAQAPDAIASVLVVETR